MPASFIKSTLFFIVQISLQKAASVYLNRPDFVLLDGMLLWNNYYCLALKAPHLRIKKSDKIDRPSVFQSSVLPKCCFKQVLKGCVVLPTKNAQRKQDKSALSVRFLELSPVEKYPEL